MVLDAEFRKFVIWNNEFIRKIDQVSFPSDVGYFSTSLDLKLDIFISNLLKIKLNLIWSFSYGKNEVALIYLKRFNISPD